MIYIYIQLSELLLSVAKIINLIQFKPARRDCIFIIALLWGHVNAPVEFVILKC